MGMLMQRDIVANISSTQRIKRRLFWPVYAFLDNGQFNWPEWVQRKWRVQETTPGISAPHSQNRTQQPIPVLRGAVITEPPHEMETV